MMLELKLHIKLTHSPSEPNKEDMNCFLLLLLHFYHIKRTRIYLKPLFCKEISPKMFLSFRIIDGVLNSLSKYTPT
jgi:hypothetical protein